MQQLIWVNYNTGEQNKDMTKTRQVHSWKDTLAVVQQYLQEQNLFSNYPSLRSIATRVYTHPIINVNAAQAVGAEHLLSTPWSGKTKMLPLAWRYPSRLMEIKSRFTRSSSSRGWSLLWSQSSSMNLCSYPPAFFFLISSALRSTQASPCWCHLRSSWTWCPSRYSRWWHLVCLGWWGTSLMHPIVLQINIQRHLLPVHLICNAEVQRSHSCVWWLWEY